MGHPAIVYLLISVALPHSKWRTTQIRPSSNVIFKLLLIYLVLCYFTAVLYNKNIARLPVLNLKVNSILIFFISEKFENKISANLVHS